MSSTNGMNPSWSFFGEGNEKTDINGNYEFDAAGRIGETMNPKKV
jgi:hypothetical protein